MNNVCIKFTEKLDVNDVFLGFKRDILFSFHYVCFGYRQYSIDLNELSLKYPNLKYDHGVLILKKGDYFNIDLLLKLFEEFQICFLLACNSKDLDEIYSFDRFIAIKEEIISNGKGFEISEFTNDYIVFSCP